MKKLILPLLLFCATILPAQNTIPNLGFEEWDSNGPKYWFSTNVLASGTVTKVTGDVKEGAAAVKLESKAIDLSSMGAGTFITAIISTMELKNEQPVYGFPFTERPVAIKFWYKYIPTADDMGNFTFHLNKWNKIYNESETVARVDFEFTQSVAEWKQVEIPITYQNEQTPDTCIIDITSSRSGISYGSEGKGATQPGSVLYIDGIELIGPPPPTPTQPVANGGFENWTTTTRSYPAHYPFNSYSDPYFLNSGGSPVSKTIGYNSPTAVLLKTDLIGGLGFIGSPNIFGNNPDAVLHGGIPYNQKPTGITGYYKYNKAGKDKGFILVAFSKNGSNIGTDTILLSGIHTDYTPFNFTFTPALTQTPDSVIILACSSNLFNEELTEEDIIGSELVLDKISFTGVTSQPELLNGDFEEWENISFEKADNWEHDIWGGKKTTDAYQGQYAMEVKNFILYDDEYMEEGRISQIIPFTNQQDVFEFYYKYTPEGNDAADIILDFQDSGHNSLYMNVGHKLFATEGTDYVKDQVEVNLPFTPAYVEIRFESGGNLGSTLKIDAVRFLSETTGIKETTVKEISIYPNPTNNGFYLPKDLVVDKVTIIDLRGAEVLNMSDRSNYVDVSSLPKGIYIVLLNTKEGIYKKKLIKK
ncbi:MAG TPA: T9SS type A sorting domain-containing protein [Bacteroidales bacterium]|nr:T9SS type A sorting domain-containing protein [Bacteroidales bacterium]